ncbi:hypothetical protein [Alkalihalobacterium chitinilyticum]|uniref:Camelysin metallo-endopeptidase n=1 Tax=Alkalihalobacterium chitinilyticum TaxID=2980103 RepID=A0ABT5VGM6_9BACI|nr:hypothetical protein [Alkalihalobacterium chitinilyticum]MDE5414611.1 hypothetical protein [Alkalihalobacterium chitinilyticum]
MNKFQKALIGTALSATLIAGVGVGTYSSWTDGQTLASLSNPAADMAVLKLDLETDRGIVNGDTEFKIFSDEDNLALLPGETASANPFFISNNGNRAFDLDVSYNGTTNHFNFRLDNTGIVGNRELFDPFIVTVDYTFLDAEGNVKKVETVSGRLSDNDTYSLLARGQRHNINPLAKNKTLLPNEKIKVEMSLKLAENATNEYQGKKISATFSAKATQNTQRLEAGRE